ncbi:MAG: hypothetical protein U9R43_13420 [Thermodesulfobacteriota bacterium]|nr:hypothetical protein [Thermodesulfobacteriota bacterium]
MILVQVMLGADPHHRKNILRHDYCFLINFLINLFLSFLKAYQEIAIYKNLQEVPLRSLRLSAKVS